MKKSLLDKLFAPLFFAFAAVLGMVACEYKTREKHVIDSCDYLRSIPAQLNNGLVNVVIEIPAGTNEKWETNKKSGHLEWPVNDEGVRRVVNYLPYPANYGMIPQTWLPADEGGDNDPLDVFLLGAAQQRGAVVQARIVGVIRIKDRNEQDDKLIAVPNQSAFENVETLADLEQQFPGVVDILVVWLENYKGPNAIHIDSVANHNTAESILNAAIAAFPRFPAPEDLN